jgi:GTP-binding protein
MNITSTKFVKGVTDTDEIFTDGTPQIAFIGRSNVGKSSLINALTNTKISRASSFPGRTQEINVFLVNNSIYFVDLPGYGFSRVSGMGKEKITDLIDCYLFNKSFTQKKVVFIIDANVGMTDKDVSMFDELARHKKDFIIALSKIDKMNQSEYHHKMTEIKKIVGQHLVFPFSTKSMKGLIPILEILLD